MTKEYREALTEVNEIFKFCDIDLIKKIPYKVKKFVESNMDIDYKFEVDLSKPMDQQKIGKKTGYILAMIYMDYLCTEDEREKIKKYQIDKKKLMEENKRYSYESIFKDKKIINDKKNEESNDLIIYKKRTWINKIKMLLKKIWER